jgi:hypothetical protein
MATANERTMSRGIGWLLLIALVIVIGVVLLVALPASVNKQSDDAIQNANARPAEATDRPQRSEEPAQPGGEAENQPQATPKSP